MIVPIELYEQIAGTNFIPDTTRIMRAFSYFEPKDTKVIILGQDPYNNRKDACGLAFSVEHEYYPHSLKNVFKELEKDLGYKLPKTGNLEPWAKQGVLLLNSILTTEEGKSLAHDKIGWQDFTQLKLQQIIDLKQPVVIIAWGKFANATVDGLKLHDNVLVLRGGHPSPLNRKRDFFGRKYFSTANKWLKTHKLTGIKWKLQK
jgi:uracil-DNA glycosylase